MMLTDAYFAKLDGSPSPQRLDLLPKWAQRYERELRYLASWFHEAQRGRPRGSAPYIKEPASISPLPMWAQEWVRTLRFECEWWKEKAIKAMPPEPLSPIRRPTTARPSRSLFPVHRRTNNPITED